MLRIAAMLPLLVAAWLLAAPPAVALPSAAGGPRAQREAGFPAPGTALQIHYLRGCRAYPEDTVALGLRVRAIAQLELMRAALAPSADAGIGAGAYTAGAATASGGDERGRSMWTSAGPTNVNGRVNSIAIDSSNRARMIVATVGGIWRTTDAGRRWQRVSDAMRPGVWGAVAITPGDSEVFAGGGDPSLNDAAVAGGPGLWRSTHYGDPGSWTHVVSRAFDRTVIVRIRVDPREPHEVYVATRTGVYLGRHVGKEVRWSRLDRFTRACTDLAVDFSTSPATVYAAVYREGASGNGIWRYDGWSWKRFSAGIPTAKSHVIKLTVAPSDSGVLYAKVTRTGDDGFLLGVYRTIAASPARGRWKGWTDITGNLRTLRGEDRLMQGWYSSTIEADPRDPNLVYLGDVKLWRGSPAAWKGEDVWRWEVISGGPEKGFTDEAIHHDHHCIAFDPSNPAVVIVGNDGGLDRTALTGGGGWYWEDIAHGMTITQFYRIATQSATPTLIAGGTQDNGSPITFGNRTWYFNPTSDGGDVACDAHGSSGLYYINTWRLTRAKNPVTNTPGVGLYKPWDDPPVPGAPFAVHCAVPGFALAARQVPENPPWLTQMRNGENWRAMPLPLSRREIITAIAIGRDTSFRDYYVGYKGAPASERVGATTRSRAGIAATHDGGETWVKGEGVPDLCPNGFAVDRRDSLRAFAALGGGGGGDGAVLITLDGGRHWKNVDGSAPGRLPDTPATGVAIDPIDADVIYAATDIGVFRGELSGLEQPVCTWAPFDEGLPPGVSVNDIAVNDSARRLLIGTLGYGAFERDLRPGAMVPPVQLCIRDNVFDRGFEPAPSGVPDPEHPVDPARNEHFEPNDSVEGRVYWWTSTDLRVDVRSRSDRRNRVEEVDHVAFESSPTRAFGSPANTIVDRSPAPGDSARLLVQVTNRGYRPARNARVMALWTEATPTPPPLPATFWSKTFLPGGGSGPLDSKSGWHLVDTVARVRTIAEVSPDYPEVVSFAFKLPANEKQPRIYLAIVDCPEDPIDLAVRSNRERRLEVLAPAQRNIAMRSPVVLEGRPAR